MPPNVFDSDLLGRGVDSTGRSPRIPPLDEGRRGVEAVPGGPPAAPATPLPSGSFQLLGAAVVSTIVGVFLSFLVFPPAVSGGLQWIALSLFLTVIMLGLSFAVRYGGTNAPTNFSAFDLIFFLSQGALWPATWPSLASLFKVQPGPFTPGPSPTPSPQAAPTAFVDLAQGLLTALGIG